MWHLKKIPNTAHFYWGNDTISFLRYLTVASFTKFNPGWKIKLYYPKAKYQGEKTWYADVRYCNFRGNNYRDKLFGMKNIEKKEVDFGQLGFNHDIPENYKADFLRWKVLSIEGGLFSDMDIIYFRPIESLYFNKKINENINTVVCINEDNDPPFHSVGFLMSSPNNNFYKFLHQKSYAEPNLLEYQSMGPDLPNTFFRTPISIKNQFPDINLHNIKMEAVYPLRDGQLASIYQSNDLSRITYETIGLHWYAGHPNSTRWENIITENNYKKIDNVLCKTIGRVIRSQRT